MGSAFVEGIDKLSGDTGSDGGDIMAEGLEINNLYNKFSNNSS